MQRQLINQFAVILKQAGMEPTDYPNFQYLYSDK